MVNQLLGISTTFLRKKEYIEQVEAHCGASLLGFVSDHRVVMILQVPQEALEFAGMSINFRSGKFGYSICPIFSKGHAEIFREF